MNRSEDWSKNATLFFNDSYVSWRFSKKLLIPSINFASAFPCFQIKKIPSIYLNHKKNNNYMPCVSSVPKRKITITSHHVSYLRNSIAYDHDFWYTFVKWWYLQVFFFIFVKFSFFGLLGGQRSKNSSKWKIRIKSIMHHISGTV